MAIHWSNPKVVAGVVVMLLASWLYISWPGNVDGKIASFKEEVLQAVDAKIASATEAITAQADAADEKFVDFLEQIVNDVNDKISSMKEKIREIEAKADKSVAEVREIANQQVQMASEVISIATKQVVIGETIAVLGKRVQGVESKMEKYKNSIDRYNSAMRAIAEQSTRAIALARTALATEEIQVYISKANFLYNKSAIPPAMTQELEKEGFRNGTKQILAVFGTADLGRSDERNRTLVRERSRAGADWIGSAANGRGGEYPAVVDPFDGANCRKLVIVYRLAAAPSATK